MLKFRLVFFFIVISVSAFGQFSYPYKVFSENGQYFIKTIPYYDQVWASLGKTIICKADDSSKVITTINRYFPPDYLFLSNNGTTACFVLNWFNPGYDPNLDAVLFYRNGVLIKKYRASIFVDTDLNSEVWSLCYNNDKIDSLAKSNGVYRKVGFYKGTDSISMYLNAHNAFVKNDTLFLLTQNRYVNKFDLNTGELIEKENFDKYIKKGLRYPQKRVIQNYTITAPNQWNLPKLTNGNDYKTLICKRMGMIYCEGKNADYENKYKHYYYKVNCGIDSSGKIFDLVVDCADSKLYKCIYDIIEHSRFDMKLPSGIDRWYFEDGGSFRIQSESESLIERQKEKVEEERQYQIRVLKDSIDGVYIPYDLNDCFRQLDSMLNIRLKEEFKKVGEGEALGMYHMGLGLGMRNSWNLWNGSRLSVYFNNMGINHPDDMSGIVLTSYHRFLNNKEIKLEEQVESYKQYWKKQKMEDSSNSKVKFKAPVIVDKEE